MTKAETRWMRLVGKKARCDVKPGGTRPKRLIRAAERVKGAAVRITSG